MEELKKNIKELASAIDSSLQWTDTLDDEISRSSLKSGIKGIRRSLNKINRVADKRPSVAIFGQSQVGKSYLVQNLTKPSSSRFLEIKVSDNKDDVNFLTEMNPDGGRESTGVVSRFTTAQKQNDETHPFKIETFNQLDVASILINSYWSDLKDYDDATDYTLDEIRQLFNTRDKASDNDRIDEDYTHFFCEYVKSNFKDTYVVKELERSGFFKELRNKLHLIHANERWEILQLLWGKNKFITELFKLLSDEIERLHYQTDLSIDFGALAPNSTTILDVQRVRELFDEDKTANVSVKLDDGRVLECDRSIISILTKEVQLHIANDFENDRARSFMKTSDILDFPGSKSREKIPLSVFNKNTTEQKLQLLVRGKVAYLFDSYTDNLGVSTLLYCMDNNPPEESEAPHRLSRWVKKYVGENREERTETLERTKELLQNESVDTEKLSPLLIVLTKFNVEIEKVIPGREADIDAHDSKWEARINENFIKYMMRPVDDKWAKEWTMSNDNFDYIFPVRDPMYSQAIFSGYELNEREDAVRPERQEAMKAMKLSFLGSEVIRDHIDQPQKVWNEISSPNGSGVLCLSEKLNISSHPIVTSAKLEIEINKIRKDLLALLKPYQTSGDMSQDLKRAKTQAAKSNTALISLANRSDDTFASILNSLLLSDTEVWNLLYDHVFGTDNLDSKDGNTEVNTDVIQSLVDLGLNLNEGMTKKELMSQLREIYEGLEEEEIAEVLKDYIDTDIETIVEHLQPRNNDSDISIASLVISYWIDKLLNKCFDSELFHKISDKQRDAFRSLIGEIIKSREYFKLESYISHIISDIKKGAVSSEDIDLVASCCTTILNKFVFTAGWAFAEEDIKPESEGEKLFSEFGETAKLNSINFERDKSTKKFLKQWSIGSKLLFEENVRFEYGLDRSFNEEKNEILNQVISTVEN